MQISGSALARVDRSSALYQKLEDAHRRIALKDPTIWGPEAAVEAAIRLNWVDLPESSRTLLPEIDALVARFPHIKQVVLAGMGGSSLAPEVIAQSFKKNLFILDSTDPQYFAHALTKDLSSTLLIVSSKSGSTIETSSARAIFTAAFQDQGLDLASHIVIITDPGSPLDLQARSQGLAVINADPHVGGRFSALTAFGLVPTAFTGVDVSVLLDQASDMKAEFLHDSHSIIDVASLLITESEQYIAFVDQGSGLKGLSDWIEQLIAESTGKLGVGRLPIAVDDVTIAAVGGAFRVSFSEGDADLVAVGSLGEHFIFWEWVTALLGSALDIDPFNQPNVTEAKNATSQLLKDWNGTLPQFSADYIDDKVAIFGEDKSVHQSLLSFLATVPEDGYISIHAYLDRKDDASVRELQNILSKKTGKPVTFGWGPRFLHSTGQFHKGGQQNGAFLQITGACTNDLDIPGEKFTLRTLLMAQALGDHAALQKRKFPLLRLHLEDRSAGILQLLTVARSL
jgi:glucose-6-phosphate isomerase